MENASKALLIAAAVLITIILITIGIKVYTSSSNTQQVAMKTGNSLSSKTKDATDLAISEINGKSSGGASGTPDTSTWTQSGTTITNGKIALQVGDTVKYETELAKAENAVNSTKLSNLKSDLATYSGNNSSSDNSSIDRDSLTWKALDIKDGKIRLISEVPTTKKIVLQGCDGYNNAVYLLDKACDTLYSINGVGKAQNLKIEDIQDHLTYDYTKYNNINTGKYGETKEFTSNLQYPNIYASEVGCKGIDGESGTNNNTGTLGLSEQGGPVTGSSTATNRLSVTRTYWYKSMSTSDFADIKYYTLFINNGSNLAGYWLSSRHVDFFSSNVRLWSTLRR